MTDGSSPGTACTPTVGSSTRGWSTSGDLQHGQRPRHGISCPGSSSVPGSGTAAAGHGAVGPRDGAASGDAGDARHAGDSSPPPDVWVHPHSQGHPSGAFIWQSGLQETAVW